MSKNAPRYPESAIKGGRFGTATMQEDWPSMTTEHQQHPVSLGAKKPAKYRNTKCEHEGIKFDSKRERSRWFELIQMQARGEISDLKLQVPFVLDPGFKAFGETFRVWKYVADFVYQKDGKTVIEDVKGVRTRDYKNKKRFMARQGLQILEVE